MSGICFLAGPDWAAHYDERQLRAEDAVRLARRPALSQRTDWRVSRALIGRTADPASLSHSRGHAALLCGMAGGIDIEYVRARDFAVLLDWVGSETERQWWRQSRDPATDFYRLWTLKEALLKAAGLSFPADMPRVGLVQVCGGRWRLHTADGAGVWHGETVRIGACVTSAVWRAEQAPPVWQAVGSLAAGGWVSLGRYE